MKNKIAMKLFVIGCAITMSLAGCTGKESGVTDTTDIPVETEIAPDEVTEDTSSENIEDNIETPLSPEVSDDNEVEEDSEDENTENSESTEDEIQDGNEEQEAETTSETTSTDSGSTSQNNTSNNNGSSSDSNNNASNNGSSTATTHTHSYGNGVITKNASCTSTGVRTYTCSCGISYTETIPVTAHSYSNGYCAVCGTADPNAVVTYTYEVYLDTEMLSLVNARRNSLGYGSYTWDSGMDETAKARARQLADNFGHDYTHPYGEFITMVTSAATTSYLHNNYVESVAHDREIHQGTYNYMSSATCVKKDNRGNTVATYNIIVTRSEQAPGASWTPGGEPDPNPPAPEDIIW